MATNSSILAWEIPWTEEPGRLQSMGAKSQTRLSTITHIITDHLDVASRVGASSKVIPSATVPCPHALLPYYLPQSGTGLPEEAGLPLAQGGIEPMAVQAVPF